MDDLVAHVEMKNANLTAKQIQDWADQATAGARKRVFLYDWPERFRAGVQLVRDERAAPALYIPVIDEALAFIPPRERVRSGYYQETGVAEPWQHGHKITLDNCKTGVIVVL